MESVRIVKGFTNIDITDLGDGIFAIQAATEEGTYQKSQQEIIIDVKKDNIIVGNFVGTIMELRETGRLK